MAENVLFDVDASQILAKLHLAGRQSLKFDNTYLFIVNTGIQNDNIKATPDKIGNVKFDLKNASGEYEVGFAMKIQYRKNFDIDNNIKNIKAYYNELIKLNELYDKVLGDKSKVSDLSDKKETKEFDELVNKLKTSLEKVMPDSSYDLKTKEGISDVVKFLDKKQENLVEQQKKDAAEYDEIQKSSMDVAIKYLTTYMTGFAGSDSVKTLNKDNIQMIQISPTINEPNDPKLVKLFAIQAIPEQEKEKLVAQSRAIFSKAPDKKNCNQHVCFKIKYNLNIDK